MAYKLTGNKDDPFTCEIEPLIGLPYRSDLTDVCIIYHGNAVQFLKDHPKYRNAQRGHTLICGRCHTIISQDSEQKAYNYVPNIVVVK